MRVRFGRRFDPLPGAPWLPRYIGEVAIIGDDWLLRAFVDLGYAVLA